MSDYKFQLSEFSLKIKTCMHIYLQSRLQQTTENPKCFIHNCSNNLNIPLFSVLQSQAVIPEGSTWCIVK